MNSIENLLREIISNQIRSRILLGLIPNERHLQAELYHELRLRLSNSYNIWVEPVIYLKEFGLYRVRPDLIITEKENIIAIIELKYLLHNEPDYNSDIEKLLKFELITNYEIEISLGSAIWKKDEPDILILKRYVIPSEVLTVFIVFGRKDCKAFKTNFEKPKNFMQVIGYFANQYELEIEYRK